MDLTDAQWNAVESYFPVEERKAPGRCGARPWIPARSVLNGVLWVLRTGAPWKDLPERYPPYQTCHRRFQGWVKKGVLPRVLAGLRKDLCGRGGSAPFLNDLIPLDRRGHIGKQLEVHQPVHTVLLRKTAKTPRRGAARLSSLGRSSHRHRGCRF